jgi:hypothetical protein
VLLKAVDDAGLSLRGQHAAGGIEAVTGVRVLREFIDEANGRYAFPRPCMVGGEI